MRKHLIVYLNGKRVELPSDQAVMSVSDFLRYERGLTGTKVVCAEGDCAACTILVSRCVDGLMTPYQSLNSCISFMYLLDKCHIVTVEGLGQPGKLHQAQEKMAKCHGSQCGFCTPGFICSLAFMSEEMIQEKKMANAQSVKNYLTGNLCRCTGYEPIIAAGLEIDLTKVESLSKQFPHVEKELSQIQDGDVYLESGAQVIRLPASLKQAVTCIGSNVKMTSGATDLGVQYNKGRYIPKTVVTLNNVNEAYQIDENEKSILFGAKVSLTSVENACKESLLEFSRLLRLFAAPGIKNAGTLVGNVVNASPIADTIPFLMVNEATILIESAREKREININNFFLGGYKELNLKPDELVSGIRVFKSTDSYKLYKVSLRKDLDISAVTFAARYSNEDGELNKLTLAFGGVGPVVLKTPQTAKEIINSKFDLVQVQKILETEITPISDLRGSREFRIQVAKNLLEKFKVEV